MTFSLHGWIWRVSQCILVTLLMCPMRKDQMHKEEFNLVQNSEKLRSKKVRGRCHRYLFSWQSRPLSPNICSQSLRSDPKRQDMTSSVIPRPEEVLQKKTRVHLGKTCTKDEVTIWPLKELMLWFGFTMNMCQVDDWMLSLFILHSCKGTYWFVCLKRLCVHLHSSGSGGLHWGMLQQSPLCKYSSDTRLMHAWMNFINTVLLSADHNVTGPSLSANGKRVWSLHTMTPTVI